MYEDMTYEAILEDALSRVPSDVDKREGSIIYDTLAPVCYKLAECYAWLCQEKFAISGLRNMNQAAFCSNAWTNVGFKYARETDQSSAYSMR